MTVLRGLLRSPAFLVGSGIFLATLLLGFVAPLFLHVDPSARVGLPYTPPGAGH